MNRSLLREIAVHIILDVDFTKDEPLNVLNNRLDKAYYDSLSTDSEVYSNYPTENDVKYLNSAVSGVYEHIEELDGYISEYAIGWKISRISRITRSILRLALFEICYMEDIPEGVSVNEAVTLTKKYDTEESGAFVNGILGAYLRRGEKA